MLDNIYAVFITICKIYGIYFGIIALFSVFGKKREEKTDEKLKFAVLIAARNEEHSISGIIKSLKQQDYPAELIDIFVITNNCTDKTASVSKSRGAKVIQAPESVRYKGGALKFAVSKLLTDEAGYDAFIVFDADSQASVNFVSSMNQTLSNGARVAKSRILAKNPEDSWLATCYDIHFSTANLFLNRARVLLGLSARLIGTGFAASSDYLREIDGFNTETITEDAEFFTICACRGEKIAFSEDAITYDEQSVDLKTSLIQRKRWMSGIMQVLLFKFKDLSRGLLKKKSGKYVFDTLVQFSFAYIQALIPFIVLLALINTPYTFIASLPSVFIKTYIYILSTALIVLLLENRMRFSANTLLGILMYPFFVLSFIPLQTISLFKKTVTWEEKYKKNIRSAFKMGNREGSISFYKVLIAPLKRLAIYFRNFGISAFVDITSFAIIIFFIKPIIGTGRAIVMASVIARITSSLINFSLNKMLFADEDISYRNSMIKYYILWISLLAMTTSFTYILNDVWKLNEVIAKILSDMSLGGFSYLMQMNWVFKTNKSSKKRGIYFKMARRALLVFMKRNLFIDEEIFMKENVLVGHHQSFYGPISCMLYFPDTVNIWVASHMFNFKDCFKIYYNHTFRKTIKLPKILALIASLLCALLIPLLIKSTGAIPVYRGSKKIIDTFKLSMEALNRGEQVLIFPDIEYGDNNNAIGEIYGGFVHLEKLFFRSNNRHLGFVPVITDRRSKLIESKSPIYFNDNTAYEEEKEVLINKIIKSINYGCSER